MTYFAFISDQCLEEAKKFNVHPDDIQKIANNIESQQSSDNLDVFGTTFVKKDLGGKFRLVIGKQYDDEDCLFFFWKIFKRDSKEYKDFIDDHRPFVDRFNKFIEDIPIIQILADKRSKTETAPLIKELTTEEKNYLYSIPSAQNTSDWMVLESEDWVKRTYKLSGKNHYLQRNSSEDFSSYVSEIQQIVINALEGSDEKTFCDNGKVGILYRRNESERILYLIAPTLKNDEDIRSLREKYKRLLRDDTTTEDMLRRSRRAYPDIILYDDTLWIHEIQNQDEKANLALSKEEADLLRPQAEGFYPLFINGRPGSGKSTILQYLFAEHLTSYYNQGKPVPIPLYLTYNEDLLKTAKQNVLLIMTCNAKKITDNRRVDPSDAEELVELGFHYFRDYVLSLLPDKQLFQEEKYVNFMKFRLLYEKIFSRHPDKAIRSISAEMAWHVIRTYIKGMFADSDEYLDPDDFVGLPIKQKSVTNETFKVIYENVWENWYKKQCVTEGIWDDQDLARRTLQLMWEDNQSLNLPNHSVIFCDEAQDFTRNELRLIFRLSIFSKRKLTPEILSRIPFAFAGDPFQTLNPTGFDWNATKENFFLTIRDQLDKRRVPQLEFNFRELSFNYRSRKNIVQLCNFIHLLRGIAFGRPGLKPQETWFDDPSNMPVYFDVDSPVLQTRLKEQPEIVIIVPCHEGEELEYVQNDPFLKTIALDPKNEKVVRNILSPMRAKGQEFFRVVIYKFGQDCLNNYGHLLKLIDPEISNNDSISPEEIIPLEYFINRLYVAASRAQRRLFIIDSSDGLDRFWKIFHSYSLEEFVDRYKNLSNGKNDGFLWTPEQHLVKIQEGDKSHWNEDQDDPVELAKKFRDSGFRSKDAYQYDLAAQNFRLSGLEDEALECEGNLYEIKQEFEEAGKRFEKLGMRDRAEHNYWKAKAFDSVVELNSGTQKSKAAHFILNQKSCSFEHVRKLHDDLVKDFQSDNIAYDNVWEKVLEAIYEALLEKSKENDLKPYEWAQIFDDAVYLQDKGMLPKSCERLVHRLEARATRFPKKLDVLDRINVSPIEIIHSYPKDYSGELSDHQFKILIEAFKKKERFDDLEEIAQRYPSLERFSYLIAAFLNDKRFDRIELLTQNFFVFLTKQKMWDVALEFTEKKFLQSSDETTKKTIQSHNWEYILDICFIKALAISADLPKAHRATKNEISKYLATRLLEQASAFYTQLTIFQAGAAVERAGMIRDCLEFYESVYNEKWPAQEEEKDFARQRWLICKQRQIDLQRRDARKKNIEGEIDQRKKEWGIKAISHLPEYPEVDIKEKPKPFKPSFISSRTDLPEFESTAANILPAEELAKKTSSFPLMNEKTPPVTTSQISTRTPSQIIVNLSCNERQIRCVLAREQGKMTINDQNMLEMVTVTANNMKVEGSDGEFKRKIEERDRSRYFIRPWNLTCVLRRLQHGIYVDLYLGEKDVELISLRLSQ